jgi:polysaccharide export outer membrane protein
MGVSMPAPFVVLTHSFLVAQWPRAESIVPRCSRSRDRSRRARRVLTTLVAVISLLPTLTNDAVAQTVASDYMAYPKNMTLMDTMRRTDLLNLTFARWPGLSADYQLGPGDEIEIKVFGAGSMDQSAKVTKQGMISIPLVGDVKAANLTATELEEVISGRLRDAKLIKEPQVLVYITGYESKQLYVYGAVDRPGLYQMTQQLRVMDAIFMAGGIDPNAGRYGYIHRKVSEIGADSTARQQLPVRAALDERTGNVRMVTDRDAAASTPAARALVENPEMAYPGTEIIRFDLEKAKMGDVLEPNLLLKAGDIVVISEAKNEFFYIIGDVYRPAAIQIAGGNGQIGGGGGSNPPPTFRKITATMAIAWAGGPTKTAKVSQGLLIRVEDGRRTEFKVDFLAMIEGRQPDIEVRANDVLFIPGSVSKSLALGILNTLPQAALLGAIR